MAIKACVHVNRLYCNSQGTMDVYFEVTSNGLSQDGLQVTVPLNQTIVQSILDVIAAAKAFATDNFGVIFGPSDTVVVYHPESTVA